MRRFARVHTIGSNLFKLESDIDRPSTSELSRGKKNGFLITLTVGVRSGGPDSRAGITIRPYAPLRAADNCLASLKDYKYQVFLDR